MDEQNQSQFGQTQVISPNQGGGGFANSSQFGTQTQTVADTSSTGVSGSNPDVLPQDLETPGTQTVDQNVAVPQAPASSELDQATPKAQRSNRPTPPQPAAPPAKRASLTKKVIIFSVIVLASILVVALAVALINRNRQSSQEAADTIPEQSVEIGDIATEGTFDVVGAGGDSRLIVNGELVARDNIVLSGGGSNTYGQIVAGELSGNHTYQLPNADGTICLDSNNCGFAIPADVNNPTTTVVNNIGGSVTIQGTSGQINVATAGSSVTLSTPQSIGTSSNPSFNSITLASVGRQNGSVLCDISNNCGYAGGSNAFVQGGNAFGASAILGTNDNNNLIFETNGTARATINTSGRFEVSSGEFASGSLALDLYVNSLAAPILTLADFGGPVGIFNADTLALSPDANSSGALVINNASDTVLFRVSNVDGGKVIIGNDNSFQPAVLRVNTDLDLNGAICNFGCWGQTNNVTVSGSAAPGNFGGLRLDYGTAAEALTLTSGYGIFVGAATTGAGSSIINNTALHVSTQTAATNNYGISVGTASTQTLWLGSNADNTTANAGIAFGSSRDTNLYRSGANILQTDDSLRVESKLQVGGSGAGTLDQCISIVGFGTCDVGLEVVNTSTNTLLPSYGSNVALDVNASSTNNTANIASNNLLALSGSQNYTATASTAVQGQAYMAGSGTVAQLTGVRGAVSALSGTLTTGVGLQAGVSQGGGTLTNAIGLQIESAVGTITNNYGVYIQDQSGAGTNSSHNLYSAGSGGNLLQGHTAIGANAAVDDSTLLDTSNTYSNVLTIEEEFTDLTSTNFVTGQTNFISLNPSAPATAAAHGQFIRIQSDESSSNDLQDVVGQTSVAGHLGDGSVSNLYGSASIAFVDASSSGAVSSVYGSYNIAGHNGSGDVGQLIGSAIEVDSSSSTGSVGSQHGALIQSTSIAENESFGLVASNVASGSLYSVGIGAINESYNATEAYGIIVASHAGDTTNQYGISISEISGSNVTNQYGIHVVDIAGATNNYGIAIEGADTQALWIGSGADNTDAANGIAFGSSRDTNLYRSAAGVLKTDNSLHVNTKLQVGATADVGTIDQCASALGLYACSVGIETVVGSSNTTTPTLAINGGAFITASGTNSADNTGAYMLLGLSGTQNYTSQLNVAVRGEAINATSGTTTKLTGLRGSVYNAAGTLTTGVALTGSVQQSGGTLTTGIGLQIESATGTIGTNYGAHIQAQTAGTTDYGLRVDTADTQTLWLSGAADNTTANAGIAFGASRDTNLYRSGANILQTDDSLRVESNLQVGGATAGTLDQCASIAGLISCDIGFEVVNEAATAFIPAYGSQSTLIVNAPGTNTETNIAGVGQLILAGSNNYTATNNVGLVGRAFTGTSGTVTQAVGVRGEAIPVSGTLTTGIGLQGRIAPLGGTLTTGIGLQIESATGTIGTNYGAHIQAQTAGTTDYGLRVDTADTQTLWLSGAADNTTANAGIAFGLSRDTNLYRSAANTLRTDDALSVGGAATFQNAVDSTNGFTVLDADGGTPILNVDTTNERVGIGVSSPNYKLHVNTDNSASTGLFLTNSYSAAPSGRISIDLNAGSDESQFSRISSLRGVSGRQDLAFSTYNGSSLNEALRIEYSGDIYIGNGVTSATPTSGILQATGGSGTDISGAALTLAGGRGTGSGTGGSVVIQTAVAGGSGSSLNTLADVAVFDESGGVQFSQYGAGTLTTDASGNITASSDARLKNISGDFTKGLEALKGLMPSNYTWNDTSGLDQTTTYTGFVAQNVQEFLPEAIGTDARGYLTLSDRPILAASVNAIKELDDRLLALEETVSNLNQASNSFGTTATGELEVTTVAADTATIATLTVTGNATFRGNIAVEGDLELGGKLLGNSLTRGKVTVPAGDTSFTYTFGESFSSEPNVTLTPTNGFAPAYRVEATANSFTVHLEEAAASNLIFNYQVQQ